MPFIENLISQTTVERLGWMLVHCLWQATAVALLLVGLLRLLRTSDANRRYVVSCLALAVMVILPVLTIQFISGAGSAAESDPTPILELSAIPSPLLTAQPVAGMPPFALRSVPETAGPAAALSWHGRMVSALKPALPYVVFGWLLGVFGLSAWHIGGWTQLQRIKRRMVQQVSPVLQNRIAELGACLGVHQAVALLESALVEVPTVVGWIRPAILLPASALTGLSPDQLEAILAHELAHIRRYDYLVNVLQTVVEILGFYHPAVWWVSRRIRIERENCCDDLAVRVCGDSLQYARALTCMEEIRHTRTAWAVAATGGSLFARIARVLGRPAVDDRRFAWLPGLLTLVLVTALLIPTAFVLGAAGPQREGDSSSPAVAEDVNSLPNPPEDQPSNTATVQVRTDANDTPPAETKASVLLEFTVVKVLSDTAMDRETTLRVLNILGATVQVATPDAARPMTAHEVLKTYVVGRELPPETVQSLMDLLRSRGYIQVESNPRVMTADGVEAKIMIGGKVPVPVPAQGKDSATTFEYVECGTAIQVTTHVESSGAVTLKMAAELTSVLPNRPGEETARIGRRAVESTVTVPAERYFSLLMEARLDEDNAAQDEAPVLVMVKPSIVASQGVRVTREDEASEPPATSADARRRQVLLDVRVVALERADLLNLGVEWGMPRLQRAFHYDSTGNGNIDSNQMAGIRLGYTSDGEFTASLLAALDLLQEAGQADILSSPRILAQDGRQSQLKVVTEEWFMMAAPTPAESSPSAPQLQKAETGTTLTVTPRVGDHNDMTLEMAIEVSDSIPSGRGSNLPIITRRLAKNAVTVKDGGTVVLAGLQESRSRSKDSSAPGLSELPLSKDQNKDKATREVAIFVTAHLVDSPEAGSSPAPKPAETTIRIPPATDREEEGKGEKSPRTSATTNLRDALTMLAQRTGAKIMNDATVKPIPIMLDFDLTGVPVSDALQRILQGTDYRFRPTGDRVYLVYRPITCLFAGRDLREALSELSELAGVPVIPDANVTGRVYADIREQPLEKAMEILLAGTPYRINRTPDFYLVADRNICEPDFIGVSETRVVPLSHTAPEQVKNLIAPAFALYIQVEPADPRDPNNRGSIVTVTAPASLADRIAADVRRFDAGPRQVLLDTRVVALGHDDLLNLGVEWGYPSVKGGGFRSTTPGNKKVLTPVWMTGIRLGYAPDQALTHSLLTQLDSLQENGRPNILASPQVLAQDGRLCLLKLLSGEWFFMTDVSRMEQLSRYTSELRKIVADTSLFITPRVGDHNNITLEMALEVSDSTPDKQGSSPPVVTRRLAKNAVTLDDGGTVVWAWPAKSGSEPKRAPGLGALPLVGPLFRNDDKDKTPREIVIFVTAHLIPEIYDSRAASGVR